MKTLLHKPIVFVILLLLIGIFFTGPTVTGYDHSVPVKASLMRIYSSDADNQICPGSSVTFTAVPPGSVSAYNWYKNGTQIEGEHSINYTTTLVLGDYAVFCIAIVGGEMVWSNILEFKVGTNTPYVEIESNDADNIVCAANDDVIFTATAYSTGAGTVAYQWKVNGSSIGYNSSAYRTTNLKDGDIVTCEITVTGGECLTSTTDASNAIQMTVMPVANPVVTIESDDADNVINQGTNVTFTASTLNTENCQVTYQWSVLSIPVVGATNSTFTTNTLKDGDVVECDIVVEGSGCRELNFDASNVIQMEVLASDAGELSGPDEICVDGWGMFSSTVAGGEWTSSNELIAYIEMSEGSILGVSAGEATITYTLPGGAFASKTIKVLDKPFAGIISIGTDYICVGSTTTLTASGQTNGIWSSSNTAVATIDGYSGLLTGISGGNAIITYTVTGGPTCAPSEAQYGVQINANPVAGVISGENAIYTGDVVQLSIQGNSRPGSWSSNNTSIATIDESGWITAVSPGQVKILYTVPGIGGCLNAIAEFDIVVSAKADAGILSGEQEICVGGYSIFLSTVPGGTWTSSDETVATIHLSGGLITGIAPGPATMTYTVEGGATATRTVTVSAPPNAGENGTLTVCSDASLTEEDLFNALGGEPDLGGTWETPVTRTIGAGVLASSVGPMAGVYTYTVHAQSPCSVDDISTVTVIVQSAPNAGWDGALTVCSGTTPTEGELFEALEGTPDAGGTWSEPVNGVYTYTVTAKAPCEGVAEARVTVTVQAPPNAGSDATLTICKGWMPSEEEMFAALGPNADMGGEWWFVDDTHYKYVVKGQGPCNQEVWATVTLIEQRPPYAGVDGEITICEGTTPSPAELFAKLGGSPDIGGTWELVDGSYYKYTVKAAPCLFPDEAIVNVHVVRAPNAGESGILEVCEGTIPTHEDLYYALGGSPDPGGTWSDPVNGVYTYIVETGAPCVIAQATVTVTERAAPNAGLDGTLTICSNETLSDSRLFNALGGRPDANGKWTPPKDILGVRAVGPVAGVYTYTVPAIFPCAEPDEATVTVEVQAAPNAGISGSLVVCAGTIPTPERLFEALGGDPDKGGTWGQPINGVYTYTVTAVTPCTGTDQATVTVTEQAAPNAGETGSLVICAGTKPTESQLFEALNGTPDLGGSWSNPATGEYSYTVKATYPCYIDDQASVYVRELRPANAGENGTLSVCTGIIPTAEQLFESLGGTPDPGGTWSGPEAGVYTYRVLGISPCPDATATVTITQLAVPTQPGTMEGSSPVCQGTEQAYSVPEVAGMKYNWTVTGTGWTIQSGQGTHSINVLVGSANATISVVAENAAGCLSNARIRTISYRPIPEITTTYIDGVPGLETSKTYGCASPLLKVVDRSGSPLYSYQWFKCNSDGTVGTPVSAPVLNLLKGNQYMVPPANGYYDEDYGDQKGIGAGTHYYYAVVTTTAGCSSKSPIFKVVVKPAEALGDYDVRSYYTGPKFVWTTTTTSNTATATLTAFVRNRDNETCGDIATARVSFEFRTSSGDWSKVPNGTNLPVSYVDPRDPSKGGTASVIAQLSIPQNQNSENYDIRVLIGGNYYNASTSDAVSICQVIVGKVVPGGSIAGGAHLPNINSTGYIQGTLVPPAYLCFGVEYIQKAKSVSSPKGRVTLRVFSKNDRTGKPTNNIHTYVVRSNAVAGLSISGNKATFTAKSNIAEEIPDLAYPGGIRVEPIEGNCVMTLKVEDWCNTLLSNVLDKVGITIQRNAGGIWYSNNWIKSRTEPGNIFGGDILVVAPSSAPIISGTSDMNSSDATASFGTSSAFNVKVFGNPSSTLFNVQVMGANDKVAMRVVDLSGRIVEIRTIAGNSNVQFGSDYRPGTYFAQFIQGDQRKTVTLIKNIR